jgi:23S rRNA pseudouridine2457 synthase
VIKCGFATSKSAWHLLLVDCSLSTIRCLPSIIRHQPLTYHYYLIYKPYQVLCQFSAEGEKKTLKDVFDVPHDVYPVGRLDYDSEGLLLLTNDASINSQLLHPSQKHHREYWVQVEGNITNEALQQLQKGVTISVEGKPFNTQPAKAFSFDVPPALPERFPPIRFRKNVPDSWLRLILTEGKNRQVRKMTAAVGFPTLRLIRYRIGHLTIEGLQPGEMRQLAKTDIQQLLRKK